MTPDHLAINQALDVAVAQVAEELLPCDTGIGKRRAETICEQLDLLAKLGKGQGEPDYGNRATPVLYSTWYQLSHINLGIAVARKMMKEWKGLGRQTELIRIVDIGSGTHALPIAFDILDYLNELKANVVIYYVEPSREMDYCGRRIRQVFSESRTLPPNRHRVLVLNHDRFNPRRGGSCFFSMMHSIVPSIDRTVSDILSAFEPVYGIATANKIRKKQFEEFQNQALNDFNPEKVELGEATLKLGMPCTRAYRKWLWNRISTAEPNPPPGIEQLLTNEIWVEDSSFIASAYRRRAA